MNKSLLIHLDEYYCALFLTNPARTTWHKLQGLTDFSLKLSSKDILPRISMSGNVFHTEKCSVPEPQYMTSIFINPFLGKNNVLDTQVKFLYKGHQLACIKNLDFNMSIAYHKISVGLEMDVLNIGQLPEFPEWMKVNVIQG